MPDGARVADALARAGGPTAKADLAALGTATSVTDNETGETRNNVNLATDPEVQAEVLEEEVSLQEDLDDYRMYPVINLGIGFRFF